MLQPFLFRMHLGNAVLKTVSAQKAWLCGTIVTLSAVLVSPTIDAQANATNDDTHDSLVTKIEENWWKGDDYYTDKPRKTRQQIVSKR